MAEATLIAELFVEGVATAAVCGSCSSEARFHARRMADTLLQAVAVAEVNVLESSSGAESRDVVVGRFVEDVVEGSAVATGQVRPPHGRGLALVPHQHRRLSVHPRDSKRRNERLCGVSASIIGARTTPVPQHNVETYCLRGTTVLHS